MIEVFLMKKLVPIGLIIIIILSGCLHFTNEIEEATEYISIKTEKREREIDGMVMINIPEGDFIKGKDEPGLVWDPQRTVHLEAFWIDRYEVTNYQFSLCVEAGVCEPPNDYSLGEIENYYDSDMSDEERMQEFYVKKI